MKLYRKHGRKIDVLPFSRADGTGKFDQVAEFIANGNAGEKYDKLSFPCYKKEKFKGVEVDFDFIKSPIPEPPNVM